MTTHTIDEAQERLRELIQRALAGENVVITEAGEPVIQLQPTRTPRPLTDAELDRLAARRATLPPATTDAATLIRQLRDEDEL